MEILKGKINTDSEKIREVLARGVSEVVERESLEKKLASGKRLRIKHGIDPTGPKIHLGRAVQFWKLKDFQEFGHQIVLIIGDFTAQIGDASDKQAMRPTLSKEQVKENMKDYLPQISKILDINETEVHYNSEWWSKLSAKDLLELQTSFTAQQLIQRRNFKERWEQGKEIGLHELNYPLLQGYDSVAIKADIEIGGSDQLFNFLAGREIQKTKKQLPQDIITLKMLTGLDERKMSTSWGNVVNISDSADDMFGKIMSMKDEMIIEYFELATQVPLSEVEEKQSRLGKGDNPRDLKMELAWEIVKMYYNETTADKTQDNFIKQFQKKELPENIPEIYLKEPKALIDILMDNKIVESKNQVRRLGEQGGLKADDQPVPAGFLVDRSLVIRVGKRRVVKVVLGK